MPVTKTLAFVCHQADLGPVLAACPPGEETLFVALDQRLAEAVQGRGGRCRLLQDFAQAGEGELRKKALLWIHEWADLPLDQGLSCRELATYEGTSLWWFMLPVIFPDLLRCVYFVERVRAVLTAVCPQRLVLVDVRRRSNHPLRLNHDENLPGKVIALTCEADGREVEYLRPNFGASCASAGRLLKAGFYRSLYYRLGGRRFIAQLRKLCSRRKPGPIRPAEPAVMVLSAPLYWRETLDGEGRKITNDAIAGNVIQQLAQRGYRVVGLDFEINTPNLKQFRVLRQKSGRRDIVWKAGECYLAGISKTERAKRRVACAALSRRFRSVPGLTSSLCFDQVPLGGVLAGRFNFLFEQYLPMVIEFGQAIEAAIAQERPKLLVLVYEEGPCGRAATIAGQRHAIPTLALQHGLLAGPYHAGFYFSKVSTDLGRDPWSCPIPTCTAVYGERTRQLLTEVSSYPCDRVEVVGMPAYDQVVNSLQVFSMEQVGRELGLDLDRPRVLVISQPFYNRDNRQFFMDTVLSAAAAMPQVQWLIKLHPSDGKGEDWQETLGRRELANAIIFERNLHELLFACDLVVAWASTTMLEAALFSRPVLAVEVPGCVSAGEILGAELALMVKGVSQLIDTVRGILGDKELGRQVVEMGRQALELHIHKADGQATKRLADLAERLIDAEELVQTNQLAGELVAHTGA